MQTIFRKLTMLALVAALAFAALPLSTTYAAGLNDTSTPPAPANPSDPTLVKARLELAFASQQAKVKLLGLAIDNFDTRTAKIQKMLDKAKEKGLDVSAVQAAFDSFKTAFVAGKPLYEKANGIVAQHSGFDSAGKVTNIEQARATVKSLTDVIKQYRDTVGSSFKALREAIRAFRQANPHFKADPTATPSNG